MQDVVHRRYGVYVGFYGLGEVSDYGSSALGFRGGFRLWGLGSLAFEIMGFGASGL